MVSASTGPLFPLLLDPATETANLVAKAYAENLALFTLAFLGAATNHGESISDGVGVVFSLLCYFLSFYLTITTQDGIAHTGASWICK